MAKRNLISVKEAAEILGLDERSVRERLINGQLKGEKKSVGLREKWFVSAASVDAAANKVKPFEPGALEEPEQPALEAEAVDVEQSSEQMSDVDWLEEERKRLRILAEEMIQPLLHTIRNQERELQQKDSQLRLLPDLQKQAEQRSSELELKHVENEALKKQIEALQQKTAALEIELTSTRTSWWKKLFSPRIDNDKQ